MSGMKKISRRDFLGTVTWTLGGLISAAIGIPAVAYIIGPALQQDKNQNWIRLGSTSKIELGTPTLLKAKIEKRTGWIVEEDKKSIYVLTDNGRDFIAMSNICTHLGCRVRWIGDVQQFYCPCHNGVYDKDGKVVSGPPPRPLDTFPVKISNGEVWVDTSKPIRRTSFNPSQINRV